MIYRLCLSADPLRFHNALPLPRVGTSVSYIAYRLIKTINKRVKIRGSATVEEIKLLRVPPGLSVSQKRQGLTDSRWFDVIHHGWNAAPCTMAGNKFNESL